MPVSRVAVVRPVMRNQRYRSQVEVMNVEDAQRPPISNRQRTRMPWPWNVAKSSAEKGVATSWPRPRTRNRHISLLPTDVLSTSTARSVRRSPIPIRTLPATAMLRQ